MRYLLIDHITEYKPDESIRGIKNVAMSEDFLEFHFPKNPIMPGVMLLEALVQLGGWLQAASSGFNTWLLVSRVRKSNFYSFAMPGDQVELEVQVISNEDNPPSPPFTKGGDTESSPLKKGAAGESLEQKGTAGESLEQTYMRKVFRGIGTVGGKKKIVAEFEGEIVPVSEIGDVDEQKRFFKILTRDLKL